MQAHQQHRFCLIALAVMAAFPYAAQANEAELSTITVTSGKSPEGPVHGSGSVATKLDAPLRDIPQSVQVVPLAVIQEQQALEMKNVLRNVSGVSVAQGEGRRDQFYIRGFDATRDMLLDGMRDDNLYFRDLGNVERIEVIKGPAAVLYGRGSAGGVINRVTKQPVNAPVREVMFTAGSHGLKRVDADLGGALNQDMAFRLTGAVEDSNSFRNVIESERYVLAPSLSWRAGTDTRVLLQTEFMHQERTPDRGIPSLNGAPADVPTSNFYGEKYDYAKTDGRNLRLSVEHAASDALTLRNNFTYSNVELDAVNTRTLGLTAGNTQVRRNLTYFPQEQTNYLNQTEAVYKLNQGRLQHTLLAGIELAHQQGHRLVGIGAASSVNLASPQQIAATPNYAALRRVINTDFDANTTALYAQDLVTLGEHWKGLAGVRFDRFKQKQTDQLTNAIQERTDSKLSPRLGVVYQPNAAHAFYANMSKSFLPAGSDLFFNGTNLAQIKPLESLQKEIGVKSDWLGGKLSSTLALFEITQKNVATRDPNDPAGIRQVQVGEQQSRGVELDVSGNLTKAWKITGSYAFTQARITRSNTFVTDSQVNNIPRHAASLWSTHDLGKGWTAGAGAFFASQRFTSDATPGATRVKLPSYVYFDAMVSYRSKAWEAGLNFYNLANKRYYESANNDFQIQPGAERSAMAYVKARF